MAFDRSFLNLMPHTVTVATLSATDVYGDASYSTSTTSYRARWVHGPEVVTNYLGEEVVSMDTVWVASTSLIPVTAEVTLPDGSSPHLISVQQYPDEDGIHHLKLNFGSAAAAGGAGG